MLEARGGIEPPIRVLQTLALPLGYRALLLRLDHALSDFSIQDDGSSDLFHWTFLLLTLMLQGEEGFMFAQSEVALKDTLTALYQFPRFEPRQEVRLFFVQMGQPQFCSQKMADAGKKLQFEIGVWPGLPVSKGDRAHETGAR